MSALADKLGVYPSTVYRYIENDAVPGPVAAAVKCWQQNGLTG